MHRSPQSVLQRDLSQLMTAPARERVALTEASSDLLGLHRTASKVPRWQYLPPRKYPVLPGRVDPSLQAYVTRTKRAAQRSYSFDRRSSELYPAPPPLKTWTFIDGASTRLVGRDPLVLYA
jgi:hypothetical protein